LASFLKQVSLQQKSPAIHNRAGQLKVYRSSSG
jgi:hypothetical protein